MVFPSDKQIECHHSIGMAIKDHNAFLVSVEKHKEAFKAGGVQFDYCPWCSMPVSQILGEDE